MKLPDLSRHAPPGFKVKPEVQFYGFYLGFALVVVFLFFLNNYLNARAALFYTNGRTRTLITDEVMTDLAQLIRATPLGLLCVLALCMPVFALLHYAYHYQGSKSIYLMRRLPDRWELHRRCLTLPVAGLVLCAAATLVLLLVCYAIYMTATPQQCLTPHQWQKIWSVIL